MIKILFICHGNICRSPMAEFILKHLVRERGCEEDNCVRGNQHRRNLERQRQSGLSAGTGGIGEARDRLRRETSRAGHEKRLRQI